MLSNIRPAMVHWKSKINEGEQGTIKINRLHTDKGTDQNMMAK